MAPPDFEILSFGPTRRQKTPGTPPGTLTLHPHAHPPNVRVIAYDESGLTDRSATTLHDLTETRGVHRQVWMNVEGLGDTGLIASLGERFGLHGLSLEDVVNVHQRAKVDEFSDHLYVVCRMPLPDSTASEQVSIFLGPDYVISFQETPGDCFDPVRRRLLNEQSRLRRSGVDYLAYALVDAIVDAYFPALEHFGERIEAMEEAVINRPETGQAAAIHALKRELLALRRAIWPLREMLNGLLREEAPFVSAETRVYLRDCYDHAVQLMDMVEIFREVLSGLVDLHLSRVNIRMNEVMKVLTVIATIFIPLGFIASVFGMNFDPDSSPWNMPETRWYLGYPLALLLMTGVAVGLLVFFRRRGWFGDAAGGEL